jgi:hypothetical protein
MEKDSQTYPNYLYYTLTWYCNNRIPVGIDTCLQFATCILAKLANKVPNSATCRHPALTVLYEVGTGMFQEFAAYLHHE